VNGEISEIFFCHDATAGRVVASMTTSIGLSETGTITVGYRYLYEHRARPAQVQWFLDIPSDGRVSSRSRADQDAASSDGRAAAGSISLVAARHRAASASRSTIQADVPCGTQCQLLPILPPSVLSEILFAYITCVKPFEALLVAKHSGKVAAQVSGDFLLTDCGGAVRSGYALRRIVVGAVQEGTPGGVNMTFRGLRHWQKALLSEHLLDGDDGTTQMLAKTIAHGARVGGDVYGTTRDVPRQSWSVCLRA
jgi:hypothetical protein